MIRDLYFLNSKELAEKLHIGEINDDFAFTHLLVYSMLFASTIGIPIAVTCSQAADFSIPYGIISFLALAAVQYWGMNLLYRTNKQGDGEDFFLRWSALSLPVGNQVWLIGLGLGIVYGMLVGLGSAGWSSSLPTTTWLVAGILFELLMQFIYFKLMQKNLTICSIGPQQAASN